MPELYGTFALKLEDGHVFEVSQRGAEFFGGDTREVLESGDFAPVCELDECGIGQHLVVVAVVAQQFFREAGGGFEVSAIEREVADFETQGLVVGRHREGLVVERASLATLFVFGGEGGAGADNQEANLNALCVGEVGAREQLRLVLGGFFDLALAQEGHEESTQGVDVVGLRAEQLTEDDFGLFGALLREVEVAECKLGDGCVGGRDSDGALVVLFGGDVVAFGLEAFGFGEVAPELSGGEGFAPGGFARGGEGFGLAQEVAGLFEAFLLEANRAETDEGVNVIGVARENCEEAFFGEFEFVAVECGVGLREFV